MCLYVHLVYKRYFPSNENVDPKIEHCHFLKNKLCRFGIEKSQICMVGDRLDTDILFGQNGGCKTLLVLSGMTNHP